MNKKKNTNNNFAFHVEVIKNNKMKEEKNCVEMLVVVRTNDKPQM